MGRVEKIVVLIVMFVVVVIFAVTLNTGDSRSNAPDAAKVAEQGTGSDTGRATSRLPLGGDPDEELAALPNEPRSAGPVGSAVPEEPEAAPERAPEVRVPADVSATPAAAERAPGTLLSSTVDTAKPQSPIRIEANWDLQSATGLELTVNPMFMLYTCRAGDTFDDLAVRYYGDVAKARLLKQNNEGVTDLSNGLQILVPVRDDSGPSTTAHKVEDGENLWSIAKRFYGRGSRWTEIYQANRDLLKSPDSLKVGMTLRIP